MAKLTLNNVGNGGPTGIAAINANNELIEAAIENTISRDGTTPNTMSGDLDLDHNDIINVGGIGVDSLSIAGIPVVPADLGSFAPNSVGTSQLIDGGVTEPKLASTLSNTLTKSVATRTALKAIDTTRYTVATLNEGDRSGTFNWQLGNFATVIAADVSGGRYIKANAVSASTGAWVRQYSDPVDIRWHGAASTESNADNKAAYEETIAVNEVLGFGSVVIPAGINYGYDLEDPTTYPNMIARAAGITYDFVTHDFGVGNTYTAPSKDGPQERVFYYHVETSPAGLHDSNVLIINGDWPPGLVINNHAMLADVGDPSRLSTDNRRCHIFFFNDGLATWRIGQGSTTGADLTDDELSDFVIAVNGVPDLSITDLTGVIKINKTNLDMRRDISRDDVFFRNTGTTKISNKSTSQSTNIQDITENANNSFTVTLTTNTNSTDTAVAIDISGTSAWDFQRNGNLMPHNDNQRNIGAGSLRCANIFSAGGVTTTSDGREKSNVILAIEDEAATRAIRNVDLVRYQWNHAIETKGEDSARLHFGVIAQQVKEAFEAEGLDAFRYGLLCYDEWEDRYEENHDEPEVRRELTLKAGNRYGVRYDQLLILATAAERKKNDELEARLIELEKKLGA
jgi:hypothetical protein